MLQQACDGEGDDSSDLQALFDSIASKQQVKAAPPISRAKDNGKGGFMAWHVKTTTVVPNKYGKRPSDCPPKSFK